MGNDVLDAATALAFSIYENKGVYALLLGSGLSRAAQIPTGWEITTDLVRRVALMSGETSLPYFWRYQAAQSAWSEFRIQLADLVADTHRRMIDQIGSAPLGPQGTWSEAEFRSRVGRYEAYSEPLARLLEVMGRWGDDQEFPLANDILRDFAYQETVSGLIAWIRLRTYPAVLSLYAYGLGLLKAGRHATLYRWLTLPLPLREEKQGTSTNFFLHAWNGGERDWWQKLDGYERRKTPLSDRLHEVFATWAKDVIPNPREFDELFETFELLAGLAFLSVTVSEDQLKTALAPQQGGHRDFVWMPVGRSVWHSEVRERVIENLRSRPTKAALLAAGFFQGNGDWFDRGIENARRMMGRFEWP